MSVSPDNSLLLPKVNKLYCAVLRHTVADWWKWCSVLWWWQDVIFLFISNVHLQLPARSSVLASWACTLCWLQPYHRLCCLLAAQMYSSAVALALSTTVVMDNHSLKGEVVFVFTLVSIVLKARIYLWLPYGILNTRSLLW